jgi:cysteinyl-tRNA synthetase
MTIKLYNSLSRQKEDFEQLDPPKVRFYSCGPTVYGEFHIGNARTFVMADVLRRWLIERGYQVTYAQNITDVDDKIIDRANKEGVPASDIAERYTAYFFDKLAQLGNLPADHHPRATQHIGGMIGMISRLIKQGHAYASEDGSVWFDVASFKEYGKLSRMPLDQMQQGERVDSEQQKLKRSPIDFALWKAAKEGEPAWKSPWGMGRPGWHIECSCMSMKVLGTETLDIHAGGQDLRFPHHENEIAQSEASTGKPFVKYWVHQGLLDIEGEKMSKSLGNIRNLDDVLKFVDALTLRYFLISARYRDKLDFTQDSLHKCQSVVQRMVIARKEAERLLKAAPELKGDWEQDAELGALWNEFAEGLDDDFNTPRALGALSKLTTTVNVLATETNLERLVRANALLLKMRNALGLGVELEKEDRELDEAMTAKLKGLVETLGSGNAGSDGAALVEQLIELRAAARKAKDFARADGIRKQLAEFGIVLEDKPGETLWKKG